MTDLEDAIQRCLTSARRQLDTGYGPELFVVLIDVDRVIRHGSATKNCDELLEGLLFCVWDMVREKNPDASADAFAQVAYEIATRTKAQPRRMALVLPSSHRAVS